MRKIISYLLGTVHQDVTLNSWSDMLDVFTGAGEKDLEDKTTTGILIMSVNSLISWTPRKQDFITLSSTETEYISIRHARRHVAEEGIGVPTSPH